MILDVDPLELVILGGLALLVIPPKDLPRAMRFAGQWIGKARGMARQFRSGFDDMIREAEFAEMEKKWKAENERIMREFPQVPGQAALPAPSEEPKTESKEDRPAMTAQPAITPEPPTVAPAPIPPDEPAHPVEAVPPADPARS